MNHKNSRGFTLIAALLLTILLSGVAVGLLYMVSNEARMGGNDLEGNLSYYAAEAQIENLTSELSQLYQTSQSPNAASISALGNNPSNWATAVPGSNLANIDYSHSGQMITWPSTLSDGVTPCPNLPNPCGSFDIVGAGPNQGMVASMIPFTLNVTATRLTSAGQVATYSAAAATGSSVTLTRTVEVALLPAFEFGIFCDGDCDYFAGPNFNFGGRVHTNNNLFLASGSKLTFTDKVAAVNQVVLDRLENGHPTSNGYTGVVYVPNAAGGCPSAPGFGPAANCLALSTGSWTGSFPPPTASSNVGGWTTLSKSTFNGFIENGNTGAKKLQLPFVNSGNQVGAIDIIRRPQTSDTPLLSSSRLYSESAIRILLADSLADLHPERGAGALDANDVRLGPALYPGGAAVGIPLTQGPGNGNTMYFGMAKNGSPVNWTLPSACAAGANSYPLAGEINNGTPCTGAWLRVEYYNGAQWVGVTQEWLGYGFGREYNYPPTAPYGAVTPCLPGVTPAGQCYNQIPAILILQQLQNGKTIANSYGAGTAGNWLPINFYDAREGEPRDQRSSATVTTACSPSGVMNVVELDVGNLWLWLQRKGPYAGGSGNLVSQTDQNGTFENGWILYFSDHRGMQPDPNATGNTLYNRMTGMSGLEDAVNSGSQTGVPDGIMEPISYYNGPAPQYPMYSPEDVNADGFLDNWGGRYLRSGFGLPIDPANMNQAYYIPGSTAGINNCATTAAWNMVTGPRHALRLVDGGMDGTGKSYLPQPIAPAKSGNGFTVASEEPVYVYGDYNSGPADPFFPTSGANATTPHSAAAIIADAVTLLSNPPSGAATPAINSPGWLDTTSFALPYCGTKNTSPGTGLAACANGRYGNTSYYRVAIAAGKSIPFPQPNWAGQDFGTDGGMHNFLRYLEDRSDGGNGATVNYAGSLISMYYSQYATGVFKCCNAVYGAPVRNYFFDTQFLNPANLPPGTPSFKDVVSLSYHQSFTTQ
ncbi:MAG TPA: PilX N-terminal domain-containing pilus assembly protein [Dongiaceae bacterium]|nr:PilX N-terminal domain-containing pilus assembly protein [Dongiaceae bacterium]